MPNAGQDLVLFTYWTNAAKGTEPTGSNHPLGALIADWRGKYPDFRLFTDTDVEALLPKWGPVLPGLFNRIRIPACRSDLARLMLLYEYGGMYFDAHVGTASVERLAAVLDQLSTKELVLFDRVDQHKSPGDRHIINFSVAARKQSAVLGKVIQTAIHNLEQQEADEAAGTGHVPYNIFVLTGPWNITSVLFDRSEPSIELRPEYRDRVHVEPLDVKYQPWPMQPYKHYHYRKPGQHWSERQNVEPLFEPRQAAAAAKSIAPDIVTCDVAPPSDVAKFTREGVTMLELYQAFSRVIEQTASPDTEPFFEDYRETMEELTRVAMSTGEEIEGSLFNAHMVKELSPIPMEVYRYKRRNFAKYVASGSTLLEVGFNAGHSALLALTANPFLTYTGVDIGKYRYTHRCYEFLKAKFGSRINVFMGDSREMLPRVECGAFDLIHIDGGHSAAVSHADLASLIKIAKVNSHILFDDASASYIIPVISFYTLTGHLSSELLPGYWEHIRPGVMPDQVLLRVCKSL